MIAFHTIECHLDFINERLEGADEQPRIRESIIVIFRSAELVPVLLLAGHVLLRKGIFGIFTAAGNLQHTV